MVLILYSVWVVFIFYIVMSIFLDSVGGFLVIYIDRGFRKLVKGYVFRN